MHKLKMPIKTQGKKWLIKKIFFAFIKYVQSKPKKKRANVAQISEMFLSVISVTHCSFSKCDVTAFLPEGEDDEAGDDENCSEHGEDEVAGFPPTCVVEHFG